MSHRGFSLIEILIVLIIIGIAGSISISGFGSAINNSEKREVKKIIEFLNDKIIHVLQTGEVLQIDFDINSAKVNNKEEFIKFNNIDILQEVSSIDATITSQNVSINICIISIKIKFKLYNQTVFVKWKTLG